MVFKGLIQPSPRVAPEILSPPRTPLRKETTTAAAYAPSAAAAASSEEVDKAEHMLSDVQQVAENFVDEIANVGGYWDTSELTDDVAGPAGALVFTLHSGANLMSADRNGLSDPYCIVKVHSSNVWRSRVAFKTLNPVWNQEHDFEGYLEDQVRRPIKIRVYDFDVLSLNDPIGKCQVDISALTQYGIDNKLSFTDVPLSGVAHGSISFDVHFELKPVFALFPGTPVHASAAQALRRRPPPDATCLERARDGNLRLHSRIRYLYFAVAWLSSLACTIGFIVVLYFGIFIPMFAGLGNATLPEREEAPWSREARFVGLSDDELMYWSNVCFQVCTALFSYLNGIAIPWRVSILCHHLSSRSSAPGCDFYGRPTEAIWFHIPQRPRAMIASFLCLSVFFHFATQATRLVWTSYEASNTMPGTAPVNITFGLSIIFAIAAGITQGGQEKKLQAMDPERYPPGLGHHFKEFYKKWRNREIKLCSLKTIKAFLNHSKEEKAKWVIANELQRMKTSSVGMTSANLNKEIMRMNMPVGAPSPSPAPSPPPALMSKADWGMPPPRVAPRQVGR